MNYIIGSGWWSAGSKKDDRQEFLGEDIIRSKEFHQLWYAALCKYTDPQKIIIVDSCSPEKPHINRSDSRMEFLSLNVNAGHSTNHLGKYCGYVRAILLGLEYAMMCETDYYVYVEQDCLLYGKGIIEYCIKKMKTPYMFGSGERTPQRLQQSFFIIRQDGILPFLYRLNKMSQTDKQICPEEKFHIACSRGPVKLLSKISQRATKSKLFNWMDWQCFKYLRNYDDLPIGYGRTRPICFENNQFYFQHGSREDMKSYLMVSGLKL